MMRALAKRAEYLQPKVVDALADGTRHRILQLLLERNERSMSFTEIRKALSIRNSATLSHHLNVLQRAWLVERMVELGHLRTAKDPYYSFYVLTSLGEEVTPRFSRAVDKRFLEETLGKARRARREERKRAMSLRETAELTGVPVGTLSYWVRTGLIEPKATTGEGRGRRHRFSMLNLIEVMTVARLRERGLPMQRLRRAVETIDERVDEERPLAMLTLVTDGEDLFEIVEGPDELAEVIRCHDGQAVFAIALDEIIEELRKSVEEVTV